ncbi:uncharacterized protein LOC117580004 isoform X1 [Drosophila guanche]|uniref:Blast:C2 domain-containing protein 3 n=2 Tax=Drosophila guanche TaxID=7266 RepID=A0A3B0JU05_DROGU|nr:uncharacterized protein LOC117580004 isoform X1 [Drosophila guanche]SPP76836.1 blast:C2 domain-containing protein 3 [Drosophila guanche]
MLTDYAQTPSNVFVKKQEEPNKCTAAEKQQSLRSPLAHIGIEESCIRFITDKSIRAKGWSYSHPSGINAKIVWWGEKPETAGSGVSIISCDAHVRGRGRNGDKKLCAGKHRNQKQRSSQHPEQQHTNTHTCTTYKLRYCVRSKSLALFLDHLRECPSIQIVAAVSDVSDHAYDHPLGRGTAAAAAAPPTAAGGAPLGQTRLLVPASLLRKYAANYVNCHFEHKTKIYALYRHLEIGAPFEQVQQQQQLRVGGSQLRFKMLFAEAAPPSAGPSVISAVAAAESPPAPPQDQPGELIAGTTNNLELMEAMKKLDAGLVALFATAAAEPLEQLKKQQALWPEPELQLQQSTAETELVITPEIFQRCNALQLHLEAVTLQPEGTHRMELLQSEVRPIFTVECQLSEDLIKSVARYPMFHVMQFESEKFQSLTQCTRFGQTQTREVQLAWKDNEDMGYVDLTIWWREPGTCLNEMLGMGRLHLRELYEASLLEQCKCVAVKRRDVHLGSIYVKISLRFDEQLAARSLANKNISNTACQKPNQNPKQIPNLNQNQNESGTNSGSTNQAATAPVNNNSKEAPTPPQPPPPPPPPPQANNNRKASLASVNFMAETTKVRLLRGYIYAGELQQLSPTDLNACQELSLQPFWQPQPLVSKLNDVGSFQLQEQFAVINDEKFLLSVDRQQLVLELRPLGGLVRLPLHQFYIAYRDASITNHLCKGKLPVISIDGWAPIVHPQTQAKLGELKVLLAIGSESQIAQLKQQRGFDQDNNQVPTTSRTTDLLDMLQNALTAPPPPAKAIDIGSGPSTTRAAPSAASKFSFDLHIVGAAGLPLNPGYGKSGKKQAKRQAAAKQRFPPNESPNTYVTFQALNSNSPTYKSHEGLVYATPVVEKSTTPQWRTKFRVEVGTDYLSNPQKLFILKLWKKAASNESGSTEPTPLEDAIIGFAALNLSHKKPGGEPSFPSGWHNIVDFNGRVTGGLEAHVEPPPAPGGTSMETVIDQFEQSMELTHLHLGQAIKRKYTELEQISQRLRTRLVDVTEQALTSPQYDVDAALDSWKMTETEGYDDELVADFERALRTPTPPNSPPPTAQSPGNKSGRE